MVYEFNVVTHCEARNSHGAQRVGFVTAAVFEARFCPPLRNEFKKTKLYTNTSPAAGTNLVLAAGRSVDR